MFQNFVIKLLEELEIPEDEMSQVEGKMVIEVNKGNPITFTEIPPEGFRVFSPIGKCPESRQEELFSHVMLGNLFGEATSGSVISLDDKTDTLQVHLDVPQCVTYAEFYGHIEIFLNTVDFWRSELESHEKESEARSDLLY